jgi:hypothetical protein
VEGVAAAAKEGELAAEAVAATVAVALPEGKSRPVAVVVAEGLPRVVPVGEAEAVGAAGSVMVYGLARGVSDDGRVAPRHVFGAGRLRFRSGLLVSLACGASGKNNTDRVGGNNTVGGAANRCAANVETQTANGRGKQGRQSPGFRIAGVKKGGYLVPSTSIG